MFRVIEINQLFTEIWPKYDIDGSGTVDANKTRIMFQDFTGTKEINKKEVHDFLVKVDKDGNGTLEKEELVHFIVEGLQMTEDEMTDYASRGHFHKLIIDFFHGVQDAKNVLVRNGKDGLRTYFYNKKTFSFVQSSAAIKIQSLYRGHIARNKYMQLLKSLAATKIQRIYRGYVCKSLYNQKQRGSVKIQTQWRR